MVRGLSQEDLAEKLGVTRRTVGEWERQGKIPPSRITDLRTVLGSAYTPGDAIDGAASPEDELDAGDGIRVEYQGWVMTLHPSPGATREQISRIRSEALATVMDRIDELGLTEPE